MIDNSYKFYSVKSDSGKTYIQMGYILKRTVNNKLLEGGLNLPISGQGIVGFSYTR